MDHLRRLYFTIPTALVDAPDGLYGNVEAFISWLEGPSAPEEISIWERRQHMILSGVMKGVEDQIPCLDHQPEPSYPPGWHAEDEIHDLV